MAGYFSDMMHSYAKIIKINMEIEEIFVSNSGYMSHMVNGLQKIRNTREVQTIVNTGNKKMMMG